MANTRVSDLSAGGAFVATDLLYAVETTGVGGVKKTLAQMAEFIRDTIGTALTAGTNISVVVDDGADTITINNTSTPYTDEMAQDAVGAMVDSTLVYVDGTPLLQRAAISGDITIAAGSNTAAITAGVITFADHATGVIREKLTAARTYYVRTDGSDSNTGLVDSAGGAFLTWQKAIDVAAGLDSDIYDVTLQCTQTGVEFDVGTGLVAKSMAGAGSVILLGDETTPSNVALDQNTNTTTSADGVLATNAVTTVYAIKGFQLKSTGTGGTRFGIVATNAKLTFQNIDIAAIASSQIRCNDNCVVEATGNYSISGGSGSHLDIAGGFFRCQSRTVTVTGTPAFTSFCSCNGGNAFAQADGNTYSGSATGKRYNILRGGVVNAGNETYFPGDAQGTFIQGGGLYAQTPRGGMPFEQRHARITTGSVAALTAADITVTWAQPFADANYTIAPCVLHADAAATLSLTIVRIVSQVAASAVIQVFNQNATTAKTGTIHAIALHD